MIKHFSTKNFGPIKVLVHQNFGFEQFWVQQFFGSKEFGSKKILAQKKMLVQKVLVLKKFGCNKILFKKLFPPKMGSKKFGKDWVSNSGYMAGMDKCHQDKFCLDRCHPDIWFLVKMGQETYLESLVKIGPV